MLIIYIVMVKGKAKGKAKGKKARKSKPSNFYARLPLGLPANYRCKLKYSDLAKTVSTSVPGYSQSYVFSMTNLVDPDVTGGGSQCPLFDNLIAVYARWRVNSCKVKVYLENQVQIPAMCTLVGLFDPNTNSPTVPQSGSTYDLSALNPRLRSARKRLGVPQSGGGASLILEKTFNPTDFIDDYHTSVNFAGITSSAPAKWASVALVMQSCESGTNSQIYSWMSFEIEYDVTFSERNELETTSYD